jgi:acetylornithine deacetylase/succinyl-diaminopimelate desuccinylase-like protein
VLHFHAHYDVVPAARPDQYEPRVADGKPYGRGASDMKGARAAMLMAVGVLEACGLPLPGRIRISLVPDEETGGKLLGTGYLFQRGHLGGGVNFNAVPDTCFFTIDRRANPEEGAEEARTELLQALEGIRSRGIDLDWEVLQEGDAAYTPPDCELAGALNAACLAVQGKVPRYVMCPALTELRFFARAGIPALVFGPGLLEVSHGPDEHVPLENLQQACAMDALTALAMLAQA